MVVNFEVDRYIRLIRVFIYVLAVKIILSNINYKIKLVGGCGADVK